MIKDGSINHMQKSASNNTF